MTPFTEKEWPKHTTVLKGRVAQWQRHEAELDTSAYGISNVVWPFSPLNYMQNTEQRILSLVSKSNSVKNCRRTDDPGV